MKKILAILLSLVTVICVAFGFIACSNKDVEYGEFYSLEQAYERGLINKENLKKIAEAYNGEKECTQTLDARTEYLIKTSILSILKNRDDIAEAKLSDAKIVKFYGEYSGCYIVKIDSNYWLYTADVVNEWYYIDGIAFHKTDHLGVVAWKK